MEIEELKELLKEPKEFNYIALVRLEEIRNLLSLVLNELKILNSKNLNKKEREGIIG